MGPASQRSPRVWWPLGPRPDAVRQRRGPLYRPPISRRSARLTANHMESVESALAVSEVRWQPCFRVIPSRYPTIHLFERVADPADWEALYWIESLTNPRLRDEVGDIELVPPDERAFGPGGSVIMAPFTHLDPAGSRFADGSFGAFYAAASLATSVSETCYHRELFLRATKQGPIELDMRCYLADVAARFHDISGKRTRLADIYDPDSYISSQVLGR